MYLIIILWILFGVAAAIVANTKEKNVGKWFLLGLLLGPFGVLFAFFAGKKCPYCMSKIHKEAIICPRCQKKLDPEHEIRLGKKLY